MIYYAIICQQCMISEVKLAISGHPAAVFLVTSNA